MFRSLVGDLRSTKSGPCDIETNHSIVVEKHALLVKQNFTTSDLGIYVADIVDLKNSYVADKITLEMQDLITHLKDNGRSDFVDQANPANDADVLREIDQYQIRMNDIQRELKKC